MIFLDAGPFIKQAIESVVAQSFQDWELILIDDGSTDSSSEIARRFHQQCPERIRYLEHTAHASLGTAASRNLGLERARGEFVTFLDADDLYLPHRLEHHVQILREMPELGVVQSDHVRWHTWTAAGRDHSLYLHRFQPTLDDSVCRPPLALMMFLAVPQLLPGICDVTVRRSLALSVGGFEGRFRVLFEDQSFISKLYLEQQVYLLPTVHAVYRRHAKSSTFKADGRSVRRAWKSDLEVSGDAYREWSRAYVENSSIDSQSLQKTLSVLNGPTGGGPLFARRIVKHTIWLIRTAALNLGAVNVYRWMLVREHRLSLRLTRAQYLRLCAKIVDDRI
jgi:glycosyltransferase involved in cell wall biosynthesis